jgi:outer membrane lipopolysaccharide assembly protein LptE/RlpB
MAKILLILLPFILTSCWPSSVSFVDSGAMPEEWKTFSVQTLELVAPNAPISYAPNLTESIKDGVQNNTRLILNTTQGQGEINIEGKVVNYAVTPIAIQPGDNAAKNRLTVTVNFTIFISEPEEDKMVLTSSRFADYSTDDDDFTTKENELIDDINKQIVQDVINKLFSNW